METRSKLLADIRRIRSQVAEDAANRAADHPLVLQLAAIDAELDKLVENLSEIPPDDPPAVRLLDRLRGLLDRLRRTPHRRVER